MNFAPTGRCGNYSTARSPRRIANVVSVGPSSQTIATLSLTTSIRGAWAELGETITRTTFKLFTGGAMGKRGQQESNLDQGIEIDMELSHVCFRFLRNWGSGSRRREARASRFLSRGLREPFSIGPELANGHLEIVADCRHHITGDVRLTPLDSTQIVGTVAEGFSQCCLGKSFCHSHLGDSPPKHLIWRV